ncbi:type I-F CRISPR-associated protein Csy2 [Thioalkalicoccus limnaeus]|uniref:Type I-F CRISPR-associated protein Csy2 n=1 Tax=Thioalkalicoccus limnaeus TaxID=120681 RepID=A0ABV4BCI3_9GAMM
MLENSRPLHRAILVLPHLRVQNANAISSPLTWGFPAITAFTGLMTALERRLGSGSGIAFYAVGIICHEFEAQITSGGFTRAFHLTRNPVLHTGESAAIVEEGRVHLELTLVFDVEISDVHLEETSRCALAECIAGELAGMRLAGGSLMPALPGHRHRPRAPVLETIPDADDSRAQAKQFRRLARRWLPGFALVSRDDLMRQRLCELREECPEATVLDAWLDLSRWNSHAVESPEDKPGDPTSNVVWHTDPHPGWIVPMPVGYAALCDLQPPGSVRGARDQTTPFRFVESIWSIGQWISPHRLERLEDLLWEPEHDPEHPTASRLYRCRNRYQPPIERPESAL